MNNLPIKVAKGGFDFVMISISFPSSSIMKGKKYCLVLLK